MIVSNAAKTKCLERPLIMNDYYVKALLEGRKTQMRKPVIAPPMQDNEGLWYKPTKNGRSYYIDEKIDLNTGKTIYHNYNDVEILNYRRAYKSPFGEVGTRFWIKECWSLINAGGYMASKSELVYRADGKRLFIDPIHIQNADPFVMPDDGGWKSSTHMPRWMSRILIEVEDLKIVRLQSLTEEDAMAEGIASEHKYILGNGNIYLQVCQNCGKKDIDHVGIVKMCYGKYDNYFDPKTYKGGFASRWDMEHRNTREKWDMNPWVWQAKFKIVN